jgi:uncharacterized sulfatase
MPDKFFRVLHLYFLGAAVFPGMASAADDRRPNILFAISDDQSWAHASAYGYKGVATPAFDRVAKMGVLFNHAFAGSPGCSPSRAALLTGRHTWMIEQAGTHASSFPRKYPVYPELLQKAGYHVGLTGKGWGPGDWQIDGWPHNPAGAAYDKRKAEPPHGFIRNNDYAGNFADFLGQKDADKPFCFWYGGSEPHRKYEEGAGLKTGKKLEDVVVPPFLPDTPEIRSDILDYLVEIEHFDRHLGRMLQLLEARGELENTLVIVTSDNGMPFPRAKANCYEYGIHVPLAIAWPARVPGNRTVDDLVGFVDLTATILEVAKVSHPASAPPPAGRSIMNVLASRKQGTVDPARDRVFAARERHSSARYGNLGYPQRALRTKDYLYIRNFAPDRWPAGAPQSLDESGKPGPMHAGYHDSDASPTLTFLAVNRDRPQFGRFFELAVARRPAEELYDIRKDPGCIVNLAGEAAHAKTRQQLARQLNDYLEKTGDARLTGNGDVWESYIRYSPLRKFPPP